MNPQQPQQNSTPAPAGGKPVKAPAAEIGGTMPTRPSGEAPKPNKKTNNNSTQNALQIAEVRDGVVIMNDGSFRTVVMAESINFDLMSPEEQDAVEFSYQGFLNSLYFPIQIFIRSQKIDLLPYLKKLDKIRTEHENMLLSVLMEDYINYMNGLSEQTNIMDKQFFVVIPFYTAVSPQQALTQSKNFLGGLGNIFKPKEQHVTINEADLEKAKSELRNRVQTVVSGLEQCGVRSVPLNTQELIELYYDTYNPDTATRQKIRNFDDLTTDIVTKGKGTAVQNHLQREME